jgi:2-oxo-4-hydroxy-4-carboxy-5-ureidoimidazoline decarboxylase
MRLEDLNMLPDDDAVREFLRCCGSTRWARAMAASRPFADRDSLGAAADRMFDELAPSDWLDAFAAHPRIGDSAPKLGTWAAQEQAGARSADDAVRRRLAARQRDYEARFGYIFIICATGRTAEEMLASLERRLSHEPADELQAAAGEQRKITHLRIAKLTGE